MLAPTACGHLWVTEPSAHGHQCHRTSPDHRAHECACSAIELRTAAYTLAASVDVDLVTPAWSR